MINFGKILKQSWKILWNYRILWIFGILLAITGASNAGSDSIRYTFGGNRSTNPPQNYNYNFQPGPYLRELTDWFNQNIAPLFEHPDQHVVTIIWIGVAILLFILIVGVIAAFVRYVSETALIRMVDGYEQTGEKVGFRGGWKMGWNRRAFRLWVIDLIIALPAILFVALLFGLGVLIFFSVTGAGRALAAAGVVAAIGCAFLFIFVFVILMVFLGLLRQFFVRSAALDGTGIGESFRNGWALFKNNWKSASLMWLIMLGVGFAYGIIGAILFFLLIPLYIVLILPAVIVAAIPAAISFGLASLFGGGPAAWIVAGVVALPFFFTILLAPLTVISGWFQIYTTNIWTLTYREIKALGVVKAEVVPAAKA